LKKNVKKKRKINITTPKIREEEEEDIRENILESKSNYIIIVSSSLISK